MSPRVPAAAALLALLAAAPSPAAGREERNFTVLVDGKPAGTHRLAWQDADGTETVTAATDVHLRVFALPYRYTLRSTETWRGGRLASLSASSDDNGTKTEVRAEAGPDGLALAVGMHARVLPGDFMPTTGWRKPAGSTLLDAEDGSVTPVRVEGPFQDRVKTAAGPVPAERYRLTGPGVECEWWFDATGRPARQEMKWDGRHVALELVGVAQ